MSESENTRTLADLRDLAVASSIPMPWQTDAPEARAEARRAGP